MRSGSKASQKRPRKIGSHSGLAAKIDPEDNNVLITSNVFFHVFVCWVLQE